MVIFTAAGSNTNSHQNHWFLALFGVVFALIGLTNAVRPQTAWQMNRWQYKNKAAMEPSAAGLVMIRVVGAVFFVVGIVFVVRSFS